MNLKVLLDRDDPMWEELERLGIENDDGCQYVLMRRDRSLSYIPVRSGEQTFYVPVDRIISIESLGHELTVHTHDGDYVTRESLKNLERLLDPDRFMRVSNNSIIAIPEIKRIEAALLQKFVLHMNGGSRVDVTRSYYNIFKDRFGI